MKDGNWVYLGQRVRALQDGGVDGRRIGDQVAEIAAHLEDSGVDPVAEFGRPPSWPAAWRSDRAHVDPGGCRRAGSPSLSPWR